jgi:hypothetical protein
MVAIVRGVETEIAPVRRSQWRPPALLLPVSPAECKFLLARLADIAATTEAIVHNPRGNVHISPWTRQQVTLRVAALVKTLRALPQHVFIVTPLDRRIQIEAIEGNPYFAQMHDSDPRLTIAAVKQANALRERLATLLGQKIRPVPLGAGRTRLVEAS